MLTSSRLYAKEFTFDKSLCTKQTTKNCVTRTEILLVSFIMYVIFNISPGLLLLKFNNTLLYQNEGGRKQQQEHQDRSPILLEFRHSSPPLCQNHKNPDVDKKIQAYAGHTESFVFSSCGCLNQSVSRLLILNWSELYSVWLLSNLQWK